MTYTPKTFNLSALSGISDKQIKVHLALYEGYVKQVNELIDTPNAPRFAFEFNGMRLHEYYFEQLEGRQTSLTSGSALEGIEAKVKETAGTRGPGWVVVYFDPVTQAFHTAFVHDHEIGQFAGLPIILVLDMWEHAYMVDYLPAEKKNYIDAFFANVNWGVIERRFDSASRRSEKMSAA
ncbi:MAG: Fe-Mn family superoxide dismutase [Candidatus Paceibacterota bacterium]